MLPPTGEMVLGTLRKGVNFSGGISWASSVWGLALGSEDASGQMEHCFLVGLFVFWKHGYPKRVQLYLEVNCTVSAQLKHTITTGSNPFHWEVSVGWMASTHKSAVFKGDCLGWGPITDVLSHIEDILHCADTKINKTGFFIRSMDVTQWQGHRGRKGSVNSRRSPFQAWAPERLLEHRKLSL